VLLLLVVVLVQLLQLAVMVHVVLVMVLKRDRRGGRRVMEIVRHHQRRPVRGRHDERGSP